MKDCETKYRCPRTGKRLVANGALLQSADGERVYPIRNSVAVLLQHPPVETPEERSQLLSLNEMASEVGCIEALRRVFGEESANFRYVTDVGRHTFIDVLPLKPSSQILEIGTSLGQFTPMLAERVAHVCGLEVVEEQARFAYQRCLQSGRENVVIACGGEDCVLPYEDESFDGVVLNLVLEWCGARSQERHEALQRRMLEEIRRVLRPGGFAFIATKNRYGLRLLLGRRDGHAHDLRFGNALPRPIMTAVLRLSGKGRPSGLLWSHRQLVRMLRSSGFNRVDGFWAAPDMRFADRYIPVASDAVRAARRQGGFREENGRILGRIMSFVPAGLVRHLAHGHVLLAFKARTTAPDTGDQNNEA